MSREYARRSRGGGNLPLIIAIVGTVIVVAVIVYFIVGNGSGISLGKTEPTATEEPTYTPVQDTPTPSPTPSATPEATVIVVIPDTTESAAIATSTATPTPAPSYSSCTVWANVLNVREGPGMSYGTIGQVKYGTTWQVYDETSSWLKIKLSSGSYGWIWADYCVRGDATVPDAPTSEPEDSIVSSATIDSSSTTITITFSEGAYGSSTYTDYVNIDEDAFTVTEDGTDVLSSVSDCGGGTTIYLYLSGATAGAEIELTVDGSQIYTVEGEDTGDYSKTFNEGADTTIPTVSSSSISAKVITITFSEAVYSSSDGAIGGSAFEVFTPSIPKGTLTYDVSHSSGGKTLTITLTNVSGAETVYVNILASSIKDASDNYVAAKGLTFAYDGT